MCLHLSKIGGENMYEFDIDKLLSVIKAQGLTISNVSSFLGIDQSTFYRKIKRKDTITIGEILALCGLLNLSVNEASDIFFGKKLA